MLILYYKPTCPFSQRVLGDAETMGVKLDLRDISNDEVLREELIARGGKKQTPYFVDTDAKVEMYESADIVAYLHAQHEKDGGMKEFAGLRVHKNDDVCDTCQ